MSTIKVGDEIELYGKGWGMRGSRCVVTREPKNGGSLFFCTLVGGDGSEWCVEPSDENSEESRLGWRRVVKDKPAAPSSSKVPTFDELEKTARPGDTAMVKVTRGDHPGVWMLPWGTWLSAKANPGTIGDAEAHHYTPAPRVKVRRVVEVARKDVREGDWAVSIDGQAYQVTTADDARKARNGSYTSYRFERVLSEEVE